MDLLQSTDLSFMLWTSGGLVRGSCQLVADLFGTQPTSPQQVVVMEFGKQHDTTHFCPSQLVTDLLFMLRPCTGKSPTCYGLAMGKLV